MVKVVGFEDWNQMKGEYEPSRFKMTPKALAKIRSARVIEGTEEDVPADALDGNDRYDPSA